jgi:hypothetical protein
MEKKKKKKKGTTIVSGSFIVSSVKLAEGNKWNKHANQSQNNK